MSNINTNLITFDACSRDHGALHGGRARHLTEHHPHETFSRIFKRKMHISILIQNAKSAYGLILLYVQEVVTQFI